MWYRSADLLYKVVLESSLKKREKNFRAEMFGLNLRYAEMKGPRPHIALAGDRLGHSNKR